MVIFDYITKENIKEYDPNWPQISDYPCQTGDFGSGKTNVLLNLISHRSDIDQMYFLDTWMWLMIFMKILKNKIQIRIVKY